MAISVPTNENLDGTDLVKVMYLDNSDYRDEWYFYDVDDVSLIAIKEEYDRSSYFESIANDLRSIGYTDIYNNHFNIDAGVSREELLDFMRFSRITLIRTHGSKNSITTSSVSITSNYLASLTTNILGYSDLIIYGACSTASGGVSDENLVTTTVACGARTVIGFENSVYSTACNLWCSNFFENYIELYETENSTIFDVCYITDLEMRNYPYYERIDADGNIVSLRNFVIAGEVTFPDP